ARDRSPCSGRSARSSGCAARRVRARPPTRRVPAHPAGTRRRAPRSRAPGAQRRPDSSRSSASAAAPRDGRPAIAGQGTQAATVARNARAAPAVGPGVMVREARPDELDGIGDLRVAAYRADGFLPATSGYTATLHALGADGRGEVLAAVDGGQIVGTVMLQGWPAGQMAQGPGEAEVRALAVAPHARGRGIGAALVTAVVERAAGRGIPRLGPLTLPHIRAAHHLYTQAGFRRLPDRDRSPRPGEILLAYGLALAP